MCLKSLLLVSPFFLDYQDYICMIWNNQIIWARRSSSTGNCSWLTFQTTLPVTCPWIPLCALGYFATLVLNLTSLPNTSNSSNEYPFSKERKQYFFYMTLPFTYLYPSCNVLFLQLTSEGPAMSKRWNYTDSESSNWTQPQPHTQFPTVRI